MRRKLPVIIWRRPEAQNLTRYRYRLLARVLALALLVAQFGVEIHIYSHPLADPPDQLGAARSCSYCLASSQLQIAVGTRASALPIHSPAWVTTVHESATQEINQRPYRAFRSRAPPALV